MALINFGAEKGEDFTYKEGDYEATIQAIENGTYTNSGLDYFKFTFRGSGFGVISASISDNFFGRKLLFELMEACGIDTDRDDVDTDEFQGKYVTIKIKQRKNKDGTPHLYNDKPQFQVSNVYAVGGDEEGEDDDVWSV